MANSRVIVLLLSCLFSLSSMADSEVASFSADSRPQLSAQVPAGKCVLVDRHIFKETTYSGQSMPVLSLADGLLRPDCPRIEDYSATIEFYSSARGAERVEDKKEFTYCLIEVSSRRRGCSAIARAFPIPEFSRGHQREICQAAAREQQERYLSSYIVFGRNGEWTQQCQRGAGGPWYPRHVRGILRRI